VTTKLPIHKRNLQYYKCICWSLTRGRKSGKQKIWMLKVLAECSNLSSKYRVICKIHHILL